MAAVEHHFSDLPPQRLYLDHDVIIDYLVSDSPRHERVRDFLQNVVTCGWTTVYLSSLTWVEFTHVIRKRSFLDALPAEWQEKYQLARWAEAQVRQTYFADLHRLLGEFLEAFDWAEVSLTREVREQALRYIMHYNLGSHDAVHLASASIAEVVDLASFDQGFRRVDGLHLWNDQVYGV